MEQRKTTFTQNTSCSDCSGDYHDKCWPSIYNPNSSILIWNLENCSRCKNILVPYFFYFQHQKLMTFFATGNCALSIFCKFKKLREFIIENWNNCSKRSETIFPQGRKRRRKMKPSWTFWHYQFSDNVTIFYPSLLYSAVG